MSELSDTAAIAAAPKNPAGDWLSEIARANKKYQEWHTKGDKVISRYLDESTDREIIQDARGRKMNLLWSNVETIRPALYSQTPEPNVSRRNKDADPVGRVASIILERAINCALDTQDFDKSVRDCVQDLLLPGRGMAIVEYVPTVDEGPSADLLAESTDDADDGDEQSEMQPAAVTQQKAILRYLHWKDTLTNPARTWDEVWWFAYRAFLTRDEVIEKFGREVGNKIQLDHKMGEGGRFTADDKRDAKATVWTIWDKRSRKVYQVSPGYEEGLLGDMEPPVKFDNFWPIPRPLDATTANDSILPIPDFQFYQDQADEIDLLTNRIYKLSESLRLRGLYAADLDSFKRMLSDATDTELIPVENWAMFTERGGMDGAVSWFPLDKVASTLKTCIEARENAKQALYEVTGISDIVRGASQASETATAQQLKSQWGSLRVRDRQRDVQRFARDAIRLMAEVIAEHFSQQTLAQMSGIKLLTNQQKQMLQQFQQVNAQRQQMGQPPLPAPPIPQDMLAAIDQPSWDDVMALLRDDKLRGFMIDVETDSTVEPDQQMEQQKAVEFIGAMTQFLTAAGPILQQAPQAAPMMGELLMFGARRFKAGETVETAIEKFVAGMEQKAQEPPPPNPQLEITKIKADAEGKKAQNEVQKSQIELQGTMLEHQHAQAEHGMNMQALQMEGAAQQQAAALAQQQHEQAMQQAQQPPGAPV